VDAFWPTFTRRPQTPPAFAGDLAMQQSAHMPTPAQVVIPLQDTPEDPFQVFVGSGDIVQAGQKIGIMGKEPNHIAVHATVSGTISAIIPMPHPLVYQINSVRISAQQKEKKIQNRPCSTVSHEDIFYFFREMGIPLDYASLPNAACLIVNATEFEPGISAKQRILIEKQEAVAGGLKLLAEASGTTKVVLICEKKDEQIRSIVWNICNKIQTATVQEVDSPFPDTIQELLRQKHARQSCDANKEASSDTSLMLDPAILAAAYDAYYHDIPFMEQLITVAGSGVQTPMNVWVPIGTLLSDIIQYAGGDPASARRVTIGGTLTGRPQYSLGAPLIKKSHAVIANIAIAFDKGRRSRFYNRCACVRCGKCVDVCPARIPPNTIAELIEHRRFDDAAGLGLFSCLECGLCYYVCPSQIPLVELLKLGKLNSRGRDSLLIFNSYKTLYS